MSEASVNAEDFRHGRRQCRNLKRGTGRGETRSLNVCTVIHCE